MNTLRQAEIGMNIREARDCEQPYPIPESYDKSKIRNIGIQQLDNGYLVTVGCQSLAIESKERLIEKFIAYINDPEETERKHMKGELFK